MACEVPCVVTDAGESARIVDETGEVVPIRDPRAFADALLRIIDMDPAAFRSLGQRARVRIRDHFSLEAVVRQYVALYQQLARRK
jgi:glycosyltransferase involved in cell wall biosynthesis